MTPTRARRASAGASRRLARRGLRPALRRAARLAAIVAVLASPATAQTPYSRFADEGADFLGPAAAPAVVDSLRLGVVGPATGAAARALRAGVELAAADANAAGGPPVVVHYRGDDGPWSSAAATAVRLVRQTGVAALIAGPDGGRAHACELVAAKLWIPVLAPAAADHTVDYANVPWTFRVGPDDGQQLTALLGAAAARGWRRLAWVDAGDRDSQVAAGTARRLAAAAGISLVAQDSTGADAVLVWSGLDAAPATLARARRRFGALPVLGPWALLGAAAPATVGGPGTVDAAPLLVCLPAAGGLAPAFARRLPPDLGRGGAWMAALAYDAVTLVVQASGATGAMPEALRAHLAAAALDGESGAIAFDGLGGRTAPPLTVRRIE